MSGRCIHGDQTLAGDLDTSRLGQSFASSSLVPGDGVCRRRRRVRGAGRDKNSRPETRLSRPNARAHTGLYLFLSLSVLPFLAIHHTSGVLSGAHPRLRTPDSGHC